MQKYENFFVGNDALSFSQYCMKPCGKKTLTNKEILSNYCLSRNRCVTKHVLGIWIGLGYLQAGLPWHQMGQSIQEWTK